MEEKKADLHNTEDSRRLKAIFNTTVDGIIIINKRGIIENCNPATAKLFGFSIEEMLGQNVKMLMPQPHRKQHDGYINNYQTSGEKKIIGIGREVEGKRKDGTTFPFKLAVSEVVLDENKIIYTGIIHDLSAQKEVESQIKKLNESLEEKISMRTEELSSTVNKLLSANKKLEFEIQQRKKAEDALRQSEVELTKALEKEKELGQLKSRFVSMASHEFRTPLSTILSSTVLIDKYIEAGKSENSKKHIGRIKSSVSNLTAILNDVLSLSKLEEGKEMVRPETFVFKTLCVEVIANMQGMLKKGQQIKHQGVNDASEVKLDKRLVKNILFNLLSNATKYSPESSTIFCKSELINNTLKICIQDEGIGIPMEDQQHLFTRFFRAANATNIQGTGLGLNIVKKYLDLMDGTISFESIEKQGTRFDISIPLKTEA